MCLAFPGKVIEIKGDFAKVDFGGGTVRDNINISMARAAIGNYVLAHAGYAIQVLKEEQAKKLLQVWDVYLSQLSPGLAALEKERAGGLT